MVELQAGKAHTCTRSKAGRLFFWGSNERGQLGTATGAPIVAKPVVVPLADVTALAAGAYHGCAMTGQQVRCWGHNGFGHLRNRC